ncbi:MAG: Hpt domain-containing protein [Candidatus Tectomicrobia bacterium]|uniref:Hpt domain-containing protein n=1 Tax=Tectimicrobiota bacterium TaxID=2528274 RepID=A0A938B1F4_UNCTE|nr:Hpt domain-containing protein [Candidatus Tectomicrobia bacterium]
MRLAICRSASKPVCCEFCKSARARGSENPDHDLFLEHTPKRLEAARLGWQEGDLEAVGRAAHSLKSTAGHLRLDTIQTLADHIERLALASQQDGMAESLPALEAAFARVAPILLAHRDTLGL